MSVGVASFRNAFVRQPDKLISFSLCESMSILISLPNESPSLPADKGTLLNLAFPFYIPGAKLRMTNKHAWVNRIPQNKRHVYIAVSKNTFSKLINRIDTSFHPIILITFLPQLRNYSRNNYTRVYLVSNDQNYCLASLSS